MIIGQLHQSLLFFFSILKSIQFDSFYRIIPSASRTVPVDNSSPMINIAQPRPQASANSRQLPPLPIPIRQLPTVENSDLMKPYFDVQNTENEDELLSARFTHPGELFYYQTSSSSSSDNSSSSENSDNENHQEQFQNNNQEEEEEEGEDDDDDDDDDNNQEINQRLRSDEDDDQTSPYEYET
jgi:hypothetical protein